MQMILQKLNLFQCINYDKGAKLIDLMTSKTYLPDSTQASVYCFRALEIFQRSRIAKIIYLFLHMNKHLRLWRNLHNSVPKYTFPCGSFKVSLVLLSFHYLCALKSCTQTSAYSYLPCLSKYSTPYSHFLYLLLLSRSLSLLLAFYIHICFLVRSLL